MAILSLLSHHCHFRENILYLSNFQLLTPVVQMTHFDEIFLTRLFLEIISHLIRSNLDEKKMNIFFVVDALLNKGH